MTQRSYYVGVLLAASRNPLNKIQFAMRKNRKGKVSLFSRISNFSYEPNTAFMKHVGDFASANAALEAINSAKQEMNDRGITVPGVTVFEVR